MKRLMLRLLVLMAMAVSPLVQANYSDATLIDERQNWDYIVKNFHSELERNRRLLEDIHNYLKKSITGFEDDCDRIEKRITELRYLLLQESPYDVFGISMYSRQIADLKLMLSQKVTRLEIIRNKFDGDYQRFSNVEPLLRKLPAAYLESSFRNRLEPGLRESEEYLASLAVARKKIDIMLERGRCCNKSLEDLNKLGQEKRAEVVGRLVFHRQFSLSDILPLAPFLISYWMNDVYEWLGIQISEDPVFWRNFVLILGFIWLPCVLAGRPLFRYLIKHVDFPEKEKKRKYFIVAWGLLLLSFAFMASFVWLGEVESGTMFLIGKILLCSAGVLFGLSVRLNYSMMRSCLWLYLPLLLQHTAAALLCLMLIPYLSLMIVFPVINIPLTIAMLILVCTVKCPLLDRLLVLFLTVASGIAVLLALGGLPYIAFTIMLLGLVIASGFQTGVAVTALVRSYSTLSDQRKIVICLWFTIILPVMWVLIIGSIVYWTAGMYNAQPIVKEYFFTDFIHPANQLFKINAADILTCFLAALVLHFVLSTAKYLVHVFFGRQAEIGLIPSFLTLATYLAWGLFLVFALLVFKVNPTSLLVVLGGMSMGLGFGMKDMAENFVSGITLLVGQQLRPGDIIQYDGIWGRVKKITVRATIVETSNNAIITFPNSVVISKDFRNWSCDSKYLLRKELKVVVDGCDEVEQLRMQLFELLAAEPEILKEPPPMINLSQSIGTAMVFSIGFSVHALVFDRVMSHLEAQIIQVVNAKNQAAVVSFDHGLQPLRGHSLYNPGSALAAD